LHVIGGTKGYMKHSIRTGGTLNASRASKEGESITPVSRFFKNLLPKKLYNISVK
jgi:hypothetical protein